MSIRPDLPQTKEHLAKDASPSEEWPSGQGYPFHGKDTSPRGRSIRPWTSSSEEWATFQGTSSHEDLVTRILPICASKQASHLLGSDPALHLLRRLLQQVLPTVQRATSHSILQTPTIHNKSSLETPKPSQAGSRCRAQVPHSGPNGACGLETRVRGFPRRTRLHLASSNLTGPREGLGHCQTPDILEDISHLPSEASTHI